MWRDLSPESAAKLKAVNIKHRHSGTVHAELIRVGVASSRGKSSACNPAAMSYEYYETADPVTCKKCLAL